MVAKTNGEEVTTDTSQEYIKMCEKAQRDLVNFCPRKDSDEQIMRVRGRWFSVDLTKAIWLPEEFQLKEIAKSIYRQRDRSSADIESEMLQDYYTFVQKSKIQYSREPNWLMFIMEKSYNKTWNGKDWQGA